MEYDRTVTVSGEIGFTSILEAIVVFSGCDSSYRLQKYLLHNKLMDEVFTYNTFRDWWKYQVILFQYGCELKKKIMQIDRVVFHNKHIYHNFLIYYTKTIL